MRVTKIDFYNDTINGLNFKTGKPSSYLHGNVNDNVRAVIEVEMQLSAYADTTYGWVMTYVKLTKQGVLQRTSGSWITEGFYAGMIFDMYSGKTYEFTAQITFVSDLEIVYQFITYTSGGRKGGDPYPGTKEDHTITATNDLGGLRYNFGLIENTESVNYISKINDRKNQYYTNVLTKGSSITLLALGTTGAHNIGTIEAKYVSNSNGVHKIVFTHDFIITPSYLDEFATQIENRQVPAFLLNDNSLKYVFEIEGRIDYNNPNGSITGAFDSLKGNVGWYDEHLNGGATGYELSSTVATTFYDTEATEFIDGIHLSKETTITATIDGANLSDTNTRFVVHLLSCVPDEVYRDSIEDYENTFELDKLDVLGENTTQGTGTITNLTASITAGVATLTITTNYAGVPDVANYKYILAVSIADISKTLPNTDKCTLLIDYQNYVLQDDVEGLFTWGDVAVVAHPSDVTEYTSYNGWPQDGLKVNFAGTIITSNGSPFLKGLRFEVMAWKDKDNYFTINSNRLDLGNYVINASHQIFDQDAVRGFKLSSDDPFNQFTLTTGTLTSDTPIDGSFSLKLPWQSWEELLDAADVFIDATKPFFGKNKLSSNYEANDYKLYIACIAEMDNGEVVTDYTHMVELNAYAYGLDSEASPQWTVATTTRDSSSNDLGGVLSTKEDTYIRARFTPASGDTTDYANYVGVVRIQEYNQTGENIYELSSVQPDFAGNILKPLAGEANLNVTVAATYVDLQCLVDFRKLKNNTSYVIGARIFTTYGGALTPVFSFDTITHAGGGTFTFPVTAKDYAASPLPSGKQVDVSFVIDSVTWWILQGLTGQDISNFTGTYSLNGSDIRPYISGEVSDGETLTLDKYDLAVFNNLYNADAEAITIVCSATDRGYTSTPDTSIVPTQLITGYGSPYHIRPLTGTNFIFADYQKGVRKLTSDTYTEVVGLLANCECTDYDSTSATVYGSSSGTGLTTRLWKWDATTRKDLGGSGVATMALLLSYSVNRFYVNNAKTNSGGSGTSYADIWLTGTLATGVKLELRYRNGMTFSAVNFSTLANTVASTAILDQVIVDANGDVWVSGVIPVTGSVLLKFSKTVAGSYYNVANWTVKLVTSANGTGSTNGDGATATAQPCFGLTIVGYDSTYGATTGTHPILLYADMGNGSYREIRHNGGVSATEKLNWTWSRPALTCGTLGGTAYTFGTGAIEVGNVYGMCMLSGDLYACGWGSPVDRIIFKVDTFGDANQVSSQLFGGTNSYAEQILI